MKTDWKESADNASSRSNIYGLLATVFREEPSVALVEELRDPRLAGVRSELGMELGEAFDDLSVTEATEALVLEFTRLFVGPDEHISAHESRFAELDFGAGGLWGTQTVAVKNFIKTTGLDYNPQYTGIPDHISVELEFMQKLSAWEADKWQQKDSANARYCLTVQRMFLDQHLLTWLPRFCDVVIAQAKLPYFRTMAELTKNYLEIEQASFSINAAA